MKKRLIVGLALLATVVGVVFAASTYCVKVVCKGCGGEQNIEVVAEDEDSAKTTARRLFNSHKKDCPGSKLRAEQVSDKYCSSLNPYNWW